MQGAAASADGAADVAASPVGPAAPQVLVQVPPGSCDQTLSTAVVLPSTHLLALQFAPSFYASTGMLTSGLWATLSLTRSDGVSYLYPLKVTQALGPADLTTHSAPVPPVFAVTQLIPPGSYNASVKASLGASASCPQAAVSFSLEAATITGNPLDSSTVSGSPGSQPVTAPRSAPDSSPTSPSTEVSGGTLQASSDRPSCALLKPSPLEHTSPGPFLVWMFVFGLFILLIRARFLPAEKPEN